jgi:hypothetical protein
MTIQYRRHLWMLIKYLSGGAVEIGVAEGRFSQEMLAWPINLSILYLVDRWAHAPTCKGDSSNPQSWHETNYAMVMQLAARHKEQVVLLRGDSVAMAERVPNKTLRLVYIDADHSYDGTLRDSIAWLPKLVPGGVMAWHDYLNPNYGVHQAVLDFALERFFNIETLKEDKDEDAGAWIQVPSK